MNKSLKHVVEIAAGLIVGTVAANVVNKGIDVVKNQVQNLKNKKEA